MIHHMSVAVEQKDGQDSRPLVGYVVFCDRCGSPLRGDDDREKVFEGQGIAAELAEAAGWRTTAGSWWCPTCTWPESSDPLPPLSGPVGESPP